MEKNKYVGLYDLKGDLYIGANAGRDIREAIINAKDKVKVMTPYISTNLVDLLISKANNGVKVLLVIQEARDKPRGNVTGHDEIVRKLLMQYCTVDSKLETDRQSYLMGSKYVKYVYTALLAIFGLSYFMDDLKPVVKGYLWYWIGTITIMLLLSRYLVDVASKIRTKSYSYQCIDNLQLIFRTSCDENRYMHTKLFVADNVAFVGSANFTESAFTYNFESRVKITDSKSVSQLASYIDRFIDDPGYNYIHQSLGQWLFREPIN